MKDRAFYAVLGLLVILSAAITFLTVRAANITICRDATSPALRFVVSGVDWESDVAPWYSALGGTIIDGVLYADAWQKGEYAGTIIVGYWNGSETITITGTDQTRACGAKGWQASAPAILIEAPGPGPYLLEVQDAYGNWSLVTDSANPDGIVLYNNGGHVELIGAPGQETNPESYRLVTR